MEESPVNFLHPIYSRTLTLGLWRITREILVSFVGKFEFSPGIKEEYQYNLSVGSESRRRRKVGYWPIVSRKNIWMWVLVLFLFLSVVGMAEGCGPGRGSGRRRAPRKLTPLVYKQHVPNVPENSLSASGLNEGKIQRGDTQRFKELVPNYNPDILFRDDEGTGADRLMSQKLREKLNTLGISVMNQWPGVKLRVIEGWDEENLHAPNSLHYEGRAVDITTTDKDWSKYGMLARLAVEAGFDWVYYESRAHIHCSVKSEAFQTGRTGGCFNSNSTVETPNGRIRISELQTGDKVLTIDSSSGDPVFSPVLAFLDRNSSEVREFYEIHTSNTKLSLTPSHLLYVIPALMEGVELASSSSFFTNLIEEEDFTNLDWMEYARITFARNVEIGDWILILDPTSKKILRKEKVLRIDSIMEEGVYAPLTTTGNLVVDGVLSSCYAVIESQSLAHWSFLPIRLLHNFSEGISNLWKKISFLVTLSQGPSEGSVVKFLSSHHHQQSQQRSSSIHNEQSKDEGVFWYASFLYAVTNRILPSSLLYNS